MYLIRHQAISPNRQTRLSTPLGKEIEIGMVIRVAEENNLPPIPALGYMMRNVNRNYA